ncbi:MAG TPA: DNA adenine methylase [Puia sp.]|nr:DNA adenine methylase [Puia sp.]
MEKGFAKPFLKWAGGKTQLIDTIEKTFPLSFMEGKFTYIEPFVGSGAILFWVLNNFPKLERVVINDINKDLINTYKVIVSDVNQLVSLLKEFQKEYHGLENNEDKKKAYYYSKRELYNTRQSNKTEQAALFIFLNRTCFNGLYRVNRSNEFNVPIGSYKNPMICDEKNLLCVSNVLQKVEILNIDFEETISFTTDNTIFYFDPPYKPLSQTSSFNSYSKDDFNDNEQIRLRNFCNKLNLLNHKWVLSNSDVRGKNINDVFFDELYENYNIERVKAKRSINANPHKRGELTELLITNFRNENSFLLSYNENFVKILENVEK